VLLDLLGKLLPSSISCKKEQAKTEDALSDVTNCNHFAFPAQCTGPNALQDMDKARPNRPLQPDARVRRHRQARA
jgi:hypothetical protein